MSKVETGGETGKGFASYTRTETQAQRYFTYDRFGFKPVYSGTQHLGWSKTFYGKDGQREEIMFRRLGARHVLPVGDPPQSAYDLVSDLHRTVFNIHPERESAVLSGVHLAPIDEEGGSVIVASKGKSLFPETLLGFSVAHGSRGDTQTSKVTVVVPESRDARIGLYLKLFQACVAAELGYTSMRWRVDPTKGLPVNRFFGLGTQATKFIMGYYGDSPYQPDSGSADRLDLVWDLNSSDVHKTIEVARRPSKRKDKKEYLSQSFKNIMHHPIVHAEPPHLLQQSYRGLALTDIHGAPLPTSDLDVDPATLLYEIPEDIESLDKNDQLRTRERLRTVFHRLINTEYYDAARVTKINPGDVITQFSPGEYTVAKFVTCFDEKMQRRNFYILTKKYLPMTM
jgi:predicted GNAT superfamily acetyltransferase